MAHMRGLIICLLPTQPLSPSMHPGCLLFLGLCLEAVTRSAASAQNALLPVILWPAPSLHPSLGSDVLVSKVSLLYLKKKKTQLPPFSILFLCFVFFTLPVFIFYLCFLSPIIHARYGQDLLIFTAVSRTPTAGLTQNQNSNICCMNKTTWKCLPWSPEASKADVLPPNLNGSQLYPMLLASTFITAHFWPWSDHIFHIWNRPTTFTSLRESLTHTTAFMLIRNLTTCFSHSISCFPSSSLCPLKLLPLTRALGVKRMWGQQLQDSSAPQMSPE